MNALRSLLVLMVGAMAGYTGLVVSRMGWNPYPSFVGDVVAMIWPGQLHLDLICCLLLCGLWIAWRHRFSAVGLLLGLLAIAGGILFIAPYLLVASTRTNGGVTGLLLGDERLAALGTRR